MRLDCGQEAKDGCCARHTLSLQPDFQEEKTAICMEVEKKGISWNCIQNIIVSAILLNVFGVQRSEEHENSVTTLSKDFVIGCRKF